MKTGRPEYYLPSRSTVARDVQEVFKRVRKRVAKMLQVREHSSLAIAKILTIFEQEHDGKLSFGTDAWTSPNSKAYIAVTVHLEQNGVPLCMLLDLVEVAESHSGFNLAKAFHEILQQFGISEKVNTFFNSP